MDDTEIQAYLEQLLAMSSDDVHRLACMIPFPHAVMLIAIMANTAADRVYENVSQGIRDD